MFDFFNEFFKSDFAKNHVIVIIITVIMLLAIGAFLMWLYMSKIYMKCLKNENAELKKKVECLNDKIVSLEKELKEVAANRDTLLVQNDRLSFYDKMTKAKKVAENEDADAAIEQFINK